MKGLTASAWRPNSIGFQRTPIGSATIPDARENAPSRPTAEPAAIGDAHFCAQRALLVLDSTSYAPGSMPSDTPRPYGL
jgi:hypothetical protein